jgi:predicted ATPase with chaperone activity
VEKQKILSPLLRFSDFAGIATKNFGSCRLHLEAYMSRFFLRVEMVTRDQKRISGPPLDRFDIHLDVPRMDDEKFASEIGQVHPAPLCAREFSPHVNDRRRASIDQA